MLDYFKILVELNECRDELAEDCAMTSCDDCEGCNLSRKLQRCIDAIKKEAAADVSCRARS